MGRKAGLFVFNEPASVVEFVRAQESRDIESTEYGSARLNVPQPYVVVLDPLGGRDESPATASKKGRRKKLDDSGSDRALNGLLTEYFVIGAASKSGKPPRWLTLGLGAWSAAKVESKGIYGPALRSQAAEIRQLGWAAKAKKPWATQPRPRKSVLLVSP